MSGNSFLSNFSFTLAVNLAIKLFWVLGIEVAVQNMLGASVYGSYFELFQFAYLFFIVLDLGLSNYNTRTLAGDHHRLKDMFGLMLSIKLVLGLVYILVLIIAATLLGYSSEKMGIVVFIGVNQALLSLMLYLRSNISALHLFKTDALLSVLDRLVMGAICGVLIWIPFSGSAFTIWHFLTAQILGYVAAVIVGFISVLRQGARLRLRWDPRVFRDILHQSYPFAILFTLMSLYTRIDAVMLGRLLPEGEFHTGVYASAFRLLEAAIIFAVLLSNLLLPMFSRMINQNEKVDALVKESFQVVLIAATVLPFGFFFYSDHIYALLYHENLEYGSAVFRLLFLNFIPMAMGYIFGTLLTAGNKLRLLNLISLGGLLLNILLNLWLIPAYQAKGAAMAAVVTQAAVILATFGFCIKYFRLSLYYFVNLRVITFVALSLLLFIVSLNINGWIYGLLSAVSGCLILAVSVGLFKPREMLKAFRSR